MRICIFLFVLLCSFQTKAQKEENRNIVISNATETYAYDINKSNSVEVKQEFVNEYTCTNYREKGGYFQFFDDQTTLDEVELVEGSKRSHPPKELQNYSISDIFYSDAKVFQLELNFPKQGWENVVKLKSTVKDPRYFCTIYFSEAYPVIKKEVSIIIPRWMKADIREYNFKGYDIRKEVIHDEKHDADIIKYTIANLPERKSESHQPGPSYFLPHILVLNKSADVDGSAVTFFNTLKDQYDWYRKIVALMKNDETVVHAKAVEITKGAKTDMEKVKSVLYWVHDNIRYVAFEDGIAGFKPDEAQDVLNKKYGDCKGMANLTKELLKSLGFDARLAWIGTNHIAYDYTTPALCVDNHMICCLIYQGKKYFLDGTESYLQLGNYAERIQGRQVLVEDGPKFMLEHIPATTPEQNLSQFTENMKIDNNSLRGNVKYQFKGESKEQMLTMIHDSKKEALQTKIERYISNDNKNYMISNVKTSDVDQTDGTLEISFDMSYEGGVSAFGNDMYIDPDYNKTFNQFQIDTTERKLDYCFYYKYNYLTEVNIELPAGYTLSSMPADLDISNPDLHFTISCKLDGNVIHYRKELKILHATLKRSSFAAWNDAVSRLSARYQDQIILTKK